MILNDVYLNLVFKCNVVKDKKMGQRMKVRKENGRRRRKEKERKKGRKERKEEEKGG